MTDELGLVLFVKVRLLDLAAENLKITQTMEVSEV